MDPRGETQGRPDFPEYGNMVREDDLYKYLLSTTKYMAIATGLVAANPYLALTSVVGAEILSLNSAPFMIEYFKDTQSFHILCDDVRKTLEKNIAEGEETIKRKKDAITEFQKEIKKEMQKITNLRKTLEHLESAMIAVIYNELGEIRGKW